MKSIEVLSFEDFQEHLKTTKTVPKYDPSREPKAVHPWWNLNKTTIHSLLKGISERVAQCMQGATNIDRELDHVAKTASTLEQIERENTVKVALIGVQGAGKSLLINALFDTPGISLTAAKGFACTSAIVRYAYGPGDKFAADVKFLNAKMREKMIDEHIRSYMDYHNDLQDSDDEGGPPRTRSHKQDELERKRKQTAEDFFDTIFGSRDEFLSTWSSSPVNSNEFKSLCQLKCKEAMDVYDLDSRGVVQFSKPDPGQLLEEIKPFLSHVDDKVCLWPLVDCVTVRLNHPLLQEGVEIIDLPGSGDVNMLRAKHADEVKDTVDVEIILGDCGRIGTDELVISTVRAGILNHGSAKVKVIATKIDILSDTELGQYPSEVCSRISALMDKTDADCLVADEANDFAHSGLCNRYKQYLYRCLRAAVIRIRADGISEKFGARLAGLSHDGPVEIIHTSTSDYMQWIKAPMISFNNQPCLPPIDTGVPRVRQFLYNLPASQNFRDYENHINVAVPAFVGKLHRVVADSERDPGFHDIQRNFDSLHKRYISGMQNGLKAHYRKDYHPSSIKKVTKDTKIYKDQVKMRVEKQWLTLRSPAFTRLIKSRGTVPQGTSKARGLETAVNWNQELANILKPGFQSWYMTHSQNLKQLRVVLLQQIDQLYRNVVSMINKSQANLIVVEKAKLKWRPHQLRLQSKITAMLDEMMAEEHRFLNRATLKDERENNFIAAITDDVFDEVFSAIPAIKATSGASKRPRYVMPILKYRKELLEKHMLTGDMPFVDRIIGLFECQLREKMEGCIDKHFTKISASLDEFSKVMGDHGPVEFLIDERGQKIRKDLEEQITYIEDKAQALQNMLPPNLRLENKSLLQDECDPGEDEGEVQDISYLLEKLSKTKRKAENASTSAKGARNTEGKGKRVKLERE